MSRTFAVVILAAGGSKRLGRPKQLVPYGGKSLVEHVAQTALDSTADEVIVVVGAAADAVGEKLRTIPVKVVSNPNWTDGMGSSIRHGIEALSSGIECAVVALCDQPHITADLLHSLALRHFESGSAIVASSYDGVLGPPCAFGSEVFPALRSLVGDSGARELIRKSSTPVDSITFTGGTVDVDTPEDLLRLNHGNE